MRICGDRLRRHLRATLLTALALCQHCSLAQGRPRAQATPSTKSSSPVGSLKQQFASARAAYQAGHYSQAWNELQPVLTGNPNNSDVNELAGLVQVSMGQDDKAHSYLAKAVRLNPNVAEWRTTLAVNLLKLHRNGEAEAQFRKAVGLEPTNYDTNHNLGEFYIQTGNLMAAIPYLRRAQRLNPNSYSNGYDLALACEQTGELDQARRQLQSLIKINDRAELHNLLAEVEEKSRNYLASAGEYEKAARMDPSESNIFDWGAELLLHQTFEPALAVFKAGLERLPQSTRLQLAVGIALYGLGHFDDGAREFCKVWDKSPSDSLPLSLAGKAYENLSSSMADEVRSRFRQFVESGGRDASIRYYYAVSLWREHEGNPESVQPAEIESLLKSAISLQRDYADAYLQLGIIYAEQHKYAEAAAQYEQALKTAPNVPATHYRLGQALSRMGDKSRAEQEFTAFERLHNQEVAATEKQNSDIQQFVYTMRNAASPANSN